MGIKDEFQVNWATKECKHVRTIFVCDESGNISKERFEKLKRVLNAMGRDVVLVGPIRVHNPFMEFVR